MVAARAQKQTISHRVRKVTVATHHKIKRHYFERMPEKRRHRIMIWVAFLTVSAIIGFQMAYPLDKGLPLANVAGKSQILASHNDMAKSIIDAFDKTRVTLVLGSDKKAEFSLKQLGAEPNTEAMIQTLSEYPFWQRFIPGSILWQPVGLSRAAIYFSYKPLEAFATEQAKSFSFTPQNARLTIKDGQIVAINEKFGSTVDAKKMINAISSVPIVLGENTFITVPAVRTEPAEKSEDLVEVRAQAEEALSHNVTISVQDKTFSPSKTQIAQWLLLGTSDQGRTTLTVDKEKIKEYVRTLDKEVGTPAGQTNITITNGRETGRDVGPLGKALDADKITDAIASGLLAEPRDINVTGELVDVQPSIIFNNKYTATQEGLQAYVSDMAKNQSMNIVVQQIDGEKWYAHADETQSIPSASTFKLYLAKILFDKIDAGEISWHDAILDTDVAGCFERMTVASTNPCAESWIAQWGRQYINDYIYRLGFSHGTSFTTGGAVQTTAADLNKYMIELYNGTILSGANRDRLLDSLGRHPYRYGIPTGSAGVVHDKVGFLWDYVHDTAIVQHPRGTYVMTVMTKGKSYGAIAAVTREIERIMYP